MKTCNVCGATENGEQIEVYGQQAIKCQYKDPITHERCRDGVIWVPNESIDGFSFMADIKGTSTSCPHCNGLGACPNL